MALRTRKQIEAFKERHGTFVVANSASEQRQVYDSAQLGDTFRSAILNGTMNAASAVEVYWKHQDDTWARRSSTLKEFFKSYFNVRVLFEQVR